MFKPFGHKKHPWCFLSTKRSVFSFTEKSVKAAWKSTSFNSNHPDFFPFQVYLSLFSCTVSHHVAELLSTRQHFLPFTYRRQSVQKKPFSYFSGQLHFSIVLFEVFPRILWKISCATSDAQISLWTRQLIPFPQHTKLQLPGRCMKILTCVWSALTSFRGCVICSVL